MRDNLPSELRSVAKKWRNKNKIVGVGEIRYDFALEEAADAIEELLLWRNEHERRKMDLS